MSVLMSPVVHVFMNGVILYVLTMLVEGMQYTGGLKFFVLGGIVLGFLNMLVKPVAKIISLPFVIVTGGLFLIVINVGILWFLSYFLDVAAFQDVTLVFESWQSYAIGAIVLGVINWTSGLIIK